MKGAIPILFLVILSLASCNLIQNNKTDRDPTHTWCVLVDMSGVRQDLQTRKRYAQNIAEVFKQIEPGDAIAIALITQSSVTEPEFLVNKIFQPFTASSDNERIVKKEKEAFDKKFADTLKAKLDSVQHFVLTSNRQSPQTDIISAIHEADNIFHKYASSAMTLVILSDMEEYSNDYNFISENLNEDRIGQILESERKKARGIPDLTGVKVYVAGAQSKDSDRFFRVRNFWMAYFDACHANLLKENYGAALIEL